MNTANKLTIFRICCIPFFMALVSFEETRTLAVILFIIASITDWLDGYLARKHNWVTNFGKFADPMADKLLVLSALILMIEVIHIPGWVVSCIICRELAVTGLRLLLVEQHIVMAADWSGKIKTVTQMLSIITLLLFPTWSIGHILLYISLVLTVYSGIMYFYKYRYIFDKF